MLGDYGDRPKCRTTARLEHDDGAAPTLRLAAELRHELLFRRLDGVVEEGVVARDADVGGQLDLDDEPRAHLHRVARELLRWGRWRASVHVLAGSRRGGRRRRRGGGRSEGGGGAPS